MYSNKQNISRVADLYEKLLSLRQDHFLSDYYSELKETLDGLDFLSTSYTRFEGISVVS